MLSHGLAELYLFQGLAGAFFGAVAPAAAPLTLILIEMQRRTVAGFRSNRSIR